MKHRYFIYTLIALELFLIFQFSLRAVSILETSSRIESARLRRDVLKKQYEDKSQRLSYVRTDTYVEEIAREKLRYGRENELLYLIPSPVLPTLPEVEMAGDNSFVWWGEVQNWFNLFFN